MFSTASSASVSFSPASDFSAMASMVETPASIRADAASAFMKGSRWMLSAGSGGSSFSRISSHSS